MNETQPPDLDNTPDILAAVAKDIVGRTVGAGDTYFSLVTTITSFTGPIYLLGIKLSANANPLVWWHLIPAVLLSISLLIIIIARFPKKVAYDFKNPVGIYQAYRDYQKQMRCPAIVATLLAWLGFVAALLVVYAA